VPAEQAVQYEQDSEPHRNERERDLMVRGLLRDLHRIEGVPT
jgi:hypothetical protein